jgi:hypothetical protein
MDFIQSLFQTSRLSSSPSPPVELCNDILFEIFLRIPPDVLPRLSILNKQSNHMINSPMFQKLYWSQKIQLPRLFAMVYYQHKLTNQIGFALINKELNQEVDNNEFHEYTQEGPQIRFPSSYYTRLIQWTKSMLQYYEMGRNDIKENEWLMTEKCDTPTRPITLHGA